MRNCLVHFWKFRFVLLVILLLTGCAQSPPIEVKQIPVSFMGKEGEPLTHARLGSVRVEPFSNYVITTTKVYHPGRKRILLGQLREILTSTEATFKDGLLSFLITPGLFGDSSSDVINARAELLSLVDTSTGLPFGRMEATVKYEFRTMHGTLILAGEITSQGGDDSLSATTRGLNCSKKTFSNNIAQLAKVVEEKLRKAWNNILDKREAKRRQERQIEAKLEKQNGYYRVISTKATVREMPEAESREVASLPQADLVHVTGSLPSGWLQVSMEGKPLGWIHSSLLREDFASTPSYKPEKPQPSVAAHTMQRYGASQYWAIIIGISKYQYTGQNGLVNLIFADDDAKAFAGVLRNLGWSESHIKLLINEEATQRNIMIALESWLTKAGPNDQIVLFWAGHGFHDPEDPEKVYFACYDTDISIPATGYRMDRVRAVLEERKAKNVILLADTCHAGKLITRGDRSISIIPQIEKMNRQKNIPKGWIFMVGAETDRQAIEHTSWRNGAFTHCLIKGLSGEADGYQNAGPKDGVVTMSELRAYLNTSMPDETQKILGVAKRPLITTSTGDPDIWDLTLQAK